MYSLNPLINIKKKKKRIHNVVIDKNYYKSINVLFLLFLIESFDIFW